MTAAQPKAWTRPANVAPACASCRFYVEVHGGPFGRCHYNPPVILSDGGTLREHWPRPNPMDWCGQFKVRP